MKRYNGLITNFRELPYNPKLKERAKEMRNNSTKGEIKFWSELLRKRQTGFQFYRQKIIGHFIVDFYCAKLKLVIEIDGISHIYKEKYDKNRNDVLESFGLKVLHFNDQDVLNNFGFIEKNFKEQLSKRIKELNLK
jgi:very-short-patch-repair endonuclease